MTPTRIVELFIDDEFEESGIEAISLVSKPAHEENWVAFGADEDVEKLTPDYIICEDDFCERNPSILQLGEPYEKLINEGWEIIKVEKVTPMMIEKMKAEQFAISSDPNAPSFLDNDEFRVRFKYVGPRDDRNRKFCSDMLAANRVFRKEDIDIMTDNVENEEFGFYDIFRWRGSFGCRHTFVRLIYAPTGKIRNSGLSTKGLEDTQAQSVNLQPDTRTRAQRENPSPEPKTWKPGMPRTGPNLFKKDDMGLEDACWEGYEPIGTKILDGREVPNCVPIKMTEDDFADTISDYPEGVKDAAKRAVAYAEKNGWGSCGTQVGKQRASQLAKGENISVDTLKRMYSFLSRHKGQGADKGTYGDGCNRLMYDAWGGDAGLKWSERKLKQLEREKMTFAVADEDKQILVGAAMIPNKMIHRYDDLGNMYFVYFSKQSIRKMADKFLKQKRTDETSIEHNGIKLGSDKVYITESWVSEDPIKDKSNLYGFELASGTWFVQMRVLDKKIWKLVKDNMLTGFSVEGLFGNKSVFSKEDKKINQIKQILKSITDE